MLWLWLTLEWHAGQLTLNTAFKLDVILVDTQMSFSHIRDDVSASNETNNQARRQILLLTSYGGAH